MPTEHRPIFSQCISDLDTIMSGVVNVQLRIARKDLWHMITIHWSPVVDVVQWTRFTFCFGMLGVRLQVPLCYLFSPLLFRVLLLFLSPSRRYRLTWCNTPTTVSTVSLPCRSFHLHSFHLPLPPRPFSEIGMGLPVR